MLDTLLVFTSARSFTDSIWCLQITSIWQTSVRRHSTYPSSKAALPRWYNVREMTSRTSARMSYVYGTTADRRMTDVATVATKEWERLRGGERLIGFCIADLYCFQHCHQGLLKSVLQILCAVKNPIAQEITGMQFDAWITCHVSHSWQNHVMAANRNVNIWKTRGNTRIPE